VVRGGLSRLVFIVVGTLLRCCRTLQRRALRSWRMPLSDAGRNGP
jgi:hypothetical protein